MALASYNHIFLRVISMNLVWICLQEVIRFSPKNKNNLYPPAPVPLQFMVSGNSIHGWWFSWSSSRWFSCKNPFLKKFNDCIVWKTSTYPTKTQLSNFLGTPGEDYLKGNPKSLNFYFLVIWWGKSMNLFGSGSICSSPPLAMMMHRRASNDQTRWGSWRRYV